MSIRPASSLSVNSTTRLLAAVLLAVTVLLRTEAGDRKVLVEIFTNAHCPLCPPAHAAVESYVVNSASGDRVIMISYHMLFPYSSDALAQSNTTDPAARYTYYGSSSSTPITYFDGNDQGRSYTSWAGVLDARVADASPLDISLAGSRNGSSISVQCTMQRTGTISQSDPVLHVAVVESPSYVGGNGVTSTNVVRKLLTPSEGTAVQFDGNGSAAITVSGTVTNADDITATSVVAFVQSVSTKAVYQAALVSTSSLTGISSGHGEVPTTLSLGQNYPNPFNPSTRISFRVDRTRRVTLTVTDLLGRPVAHLVDRTLPPGTYTETWDAAGSPSGSYLAVLVSGGTRLATRMVLIR